MRLNKFLAHAGIASRRRCDELINAGKIKINHHVVYDFSYQVTEEDYVECGGNVVQWKVERVVYLLNKPAGYICSSNDPQHRKKVLDLLPDKHRLFTVGRLDRDTTGALLITNDGDLAYKLTHPKFEIEKCYIVVTKNDIPYQKLKLIKNGIRLDNAEIAKGRIRRLEKKEKKVIWELILTEGKNREVKRLFLVLGTNVDSLHRKYFAGISVENLKPGRFRRIKKTELNRLIQESS